MEIASFSSRQWSTAANSHRWLMPTVLTVVPMTLVIAALLSEYIAGTAPCMLCYIQRFPHVVAGLAALCAWALRHDDVFYLLFLGVCAAALAFSTLFSIFHTGGELGFWDLSAACQVTMVQNGIQTQPDFFRAQAGTDCARSAWRLFGLPMAGFNIIASSGLSALCALWITMILPRLDLNAPRA